MTRSLPIKGRFAPSPTGELHLGSLTTAVASFCHIKSLGGSWTVRIEDVDFERCKPAYTAQILTDLEQLHLHADDIVYQSKRISLYNDYIDSSHHTIYPCTCSRKYLSTLGDGVYPRICTPTPPYSPSIPLSAKTGKLRLILPDIHIGFFDELQGIHWQNPQQLLGDSVIKRQNAMINYIWACAIDDGIDGITHVMRGLDILPMTAAQLVIIKSLALIAPSHYYHLPLLLNANGQKLSKQNLARPIDTCHPAQTLTTALRLLGQKAPTYLDKATPTDVLNHAITHWDNTPLCYKKTLGIGA